MIDFKISKSNSLLFLAAIIWGFAFVAQRAGMEHIGPYAFNGIRFALGALTLIPFYLILKPKTSTQQVYQARHLKTGGLLAGIILFAGASFQQVGIIYTTAGNAGFITSLYVIMVPVLGLLWGHKTSFLTWVGVLFATFGLYFLSIQDAFTLSEGDSIVLLAAIFFAFHVIIIGWYSNKTNPVLLSIVQFAICAVLSFIISFLTEDTSWSGIKAAAIPLLYGGILSVGVAFTLQVIGQRKAKPATAAIILSFESIFALVGGWLILNELFTPRDILGCSLMLMGIIISQVKINNNQD
jgi:drug/metabolite transporter (DMT)-like permease